MSLAEREISVEIIESCRRGDRDAFRLVYEAYKDKVYSISLYFFHGDAAAASDATQQVFLKLITRIHQFRGNATFSTWLYRLVVNTCTDAARQRRSGTVDAFTTPHVRAVSQEDEYERMQIANSVQLAVSSLPPKFRIAVLLRYFEDLSYDELAKALRCSAGTVASRLSRGHKMLAEKLAPLKTRLTRGER